MPYPSVPRSSEHLTVHCQYSSQASPLKERFNHFTFDGLPEDRPFFRQIPIRPGLTLAVLNFKPLENPRISFSMDNTPVQFSCCLAGESRISMHHGPDREYRIRPGVTNTYFAPGCFGDCHMHPDEAQQSVGLQVDPAFLLELMTSDPRFSTMPDPIQGLKGRRPFVLEADATPGMVAVTRAIFECPYHGKMAQLFYEGKALELLCFHIDQIMETSSVESSNCKISRSDLDRLHEASRILEESLKTPPSLAQLARLTGLNTFKLKQGFKAVYGSTVFGYYRKHKMKQACAILEEGRMNVSETAFEMGYSNTSHFIAAFKREIGLTPGSVARQARKRIVSSAHEAHPLQTMDS